MTFDSKTPNADCIYRVDALNTFGVEHNALCSQPMARTFTQSSPHILGGGLMMPWPWVVYFSSESQNGELQSFKEKITICTPEITDVFRFDMIEGSAQSLEVDNQMIIPQSMAQRFFGNQSAIGKRIETDFDLIGDGTYTVSGVYKDFPSNSSITNHAFVSMGDFGKDEWGSNNASLYIRLDSPSSADGLLDNFYRYAKQIGLEEMMQKNTTMGVYEMKLMPLRELHSHLHSRIYLPEAMQPDIIHTNGRKSSRRMHSPFSRKRGSSIRKWPVHSGKTYSRKEVLKTLPSFTSVSAAIIRSRKLSWRSSVS